MNPAEILAGLKDSNPQKCYRMLKRLVSQGYHQEDAAVLKTLIRTCKKAKPVYNRLEAMRALRPFWKNEDARNAILSRLKDETFIINPCLEIIGSIADQHALEALLDFYQKSAKPQTKCQVLRSLSKASLTDVFQFLRITKAHESPDESLRSTVVALLGERKDPTLKKMFMQALGDKNSRVRANAVEALEQLLPKKELAKVMAYCCLLYTSPSPRD